MYASIEKEKGDVTVLRTSLESAGKRVAWRREASQGEMTLRESLNLLQQKRKKGPRGRASVVKKVGGLESLA